MGKVGDGETETQQILSPPLPLTLELGHTSLRWDRVRYAVLKPMPAT
jgi:hypothetical protein